MNKNYCFTYILHVLDYNVHREISINLPLNDGMVTTGFYRPLILNSMGGMAFVDEAKSSMTIDEFRKDCQFMIDYINERQLDILDIESYNSALEKIVEKHIQQFNRITVDDLMSYLDECFLILSNMGWTSDKIKKEYPLYLVYFINKYGTLVKESFPTMSNTIIPFINSPRYQTLINYIKNEHFDAPIAVNAQAFVKNIKQYLSDNYIPFSIINSRCDSEMEDLSKVNELSEEIDLSYAYRIFIRIFPAIHGAKMHGSMIIYIGYHDELLATTIHGVEESLLNSASLYGFIYSKVELVSQSDRTYRFYFSQNKCNLNLNSRSRELINRIWFGLKHHPMYSSHEIIKDEVSYSDAGAIAIKVKLNCSPVLMFLFYPSYGNGNIDSVAIYGNGLDAQKRAIESSMQIFGLPVKSIKWDRGIERFLDVALDSY